MVFGSRDRMGVRLLILRMIYTWETFKWGKGRFGILKENMGGGDLFDGCKNDTCYYVPRLIPGIHPVLGQASKRYASNSKWGTELWECF